jgi:hypothetical protein
MEFFEGISVAFDFEDLSNISQLRKLYLKHDSENKKSLNKDEFVKFLLEIFLTGFLTFYSKKKKIWNLSLNYLVKR